MPKRRPRRGTLLLCIECERKGKPYPFLPPDAFYRHTQRTDGTWRRDSYCIECRNAYTNETRNARYKHDPAYRASESKRYAKRWDRIAKENEGERRARRELAAKLIAGMRANGWTVSLIAAAVGSSRSQVWKWQRQVMTPSERNLALLRELAREPEEETLADGAAANARAAMRRAA